MCGNTLPTLTAAAPHLYAPLSIPTPAGGQFSHGCHDGSVCRGAEPGRAGAVRPAGVQSSRGLALLRAGTSFQPSVTFGTAPLLHA
jgi:hypothetical protein